MDTFRADENGLIFIRIIKERSKQMVKNPEIEVCYFAEGFR